LIEDLQPLPEPDIAALTAEPRVGSDHEKGRAVDEFVSHLDTRLARALFASRSFLAEDLGDRPCVFWVPMTVAVGERLQRSLKTEGDNTGC
jgi:hypothetical protein